MSGPGVEPLPLDAATWLPGLPVQPPGLPAQPRLPRPGCWLPPGPAGGATGGRSARLLSSKVIEEKHPYDPILIIIIFG